MAKKFDFDIKDLSNPASNFVTQGNAEKKNKITENNIVSAKKEARSKRMQILLQPSLFDKIQQKAESEGTSVNSLIHETLEGLF